jgi:SAM-dependent methyltransferase
MSILEIAHRYWTSEKLKKLTGGKKLLLLPSNGADLLYSLGLMNRDSSISADSVRKYLQINHMLELTRRPLEKLKDRFEKVRILDCGCGNSYLTFLIAWYFKEILKHPCEIVGIDTNPKVIERSQEKAAQLGFSDIVRFENKSVASFMEELRLSQEKSEKSLRFHAVYSLHACDTATDDALGLALQNSADFIASAPCCQAELAHQWTELAAKNSDHIFKVVINAPLLRRETGAVMTDALRILLLRGSGYEVTTTEFVPSTHTPKNRLILAERRGSYLLEPLSEYKSLAQNLGGISIKLEQLIPAKIKGLLAE